MRKLLLLSHGGEKPALPQFEGSAYWPSAGRWRLGAVADRPRAAISSLPTTLRVIRRGFSCVALSFAQRSLLVPPSLFLLGSGARRPLSFCPIPAVVRFECHWIPVMRWIDLPPGNHIYARVRFYLSLLLARPGLLPKATLKSDVRLRDVARV